MRTLTPERELEIARRVRDTFDCPNRWCRGGWGRDDRGDTLQFDGGFHARDAEGRPHPPALDVRPSGRLRCFCLGAAIRIHTGAVLCLDPADVGQLADRMCTTYVRVGKLYRHVSHNNALEPYLEAVIEWNDQKDRHFVDIQTLAASVVEHLGAATGT